MVDFIRNGLVKIWGTGRKWEFQNEKFLPSAELKPIASRLLDWHSKGLCHQTILTVDIYT